MSENGAPENGRDILNSQCSAEEIARSLREPAEREWAYFTRRRGMGLGVGVGEDGHIVSQLQVDTDASGISSKAVMRVFGNIADAWGLTVEERTHLLGIDEPGVIEAILAGDQPMSPEIIERISYCFGIFKAINTLLPEPQADTWLKRANSYSLFEGRDALSYILANGKEGLRAVRQYLDAECH